MQSRPKVYIAGPECFMKDSDERAENALKLCEYYGFEGFSPTKPYPEAPAIDFTNPDRKQVAVEICRKNMWLIENCDLIIANVNPFRGEEPDGGTSFEMGYGYMLGKKLYCFLDDVRSCVDKYKGEKVMCSDGVLRDSEGRFFETGCLNLMLSAPAEVVEGTFEDAIKVAAKDFFKEDER